MSARRTRRRESAGFTLLELLVAIGILAFMIGIAWAAVSQTVRARTHFGAVQDRYREARAALSRLVRDIEMSYVSKNEDRSVAEPRTSFIGESRGEVHTLRMSTFSHLRLYEQANESDQTQIWYYGLPSRDGKGKTDLVRRETRRLMPEKPSSIPADADVIFHDVKSFRLSYYDPRNADWKDDWSTLGTEGGQDPRLPFRVKVELTFVGEDGKDVVLVTAARVNLTETLSSFAR